MRQIEPTQKQGFRKQYTKFMIEQGFFQLLENRELKKITVTDICKTVGINRGTFYLYYYDVDDLLEDLLDGMLVGITGNKENKTFINGFAQYIVDLTDGDARTEEKWRLILQDESACERMLDKVIQISKKDYVSYLSSHSPLTATQAEAIFYYQINGIFTIFKISIQQNDENWDEIREAVCRFSEGGLETLLSCS